MTSADELSALRARIDRLDDQLLRLLAERLEVARQMGEVKRRAGSLRRDADREARIIERLATADVPPEIVRSVWQALFAASRRVQDCHD